MKYISKALVISFFITMYFSIRVKAQTNYNDVAKIFYTRCTSCHHDGGVSGFSLLTYQDALNYISFIQNDLITSHMPPWYPDTTYTADSYPVTRFQHENSITNIEKNKILQWINDGTLQGNTALLPPAPVYNDTKYKLNGIASLTLKIPDFASNASLTNQNPHDCFSVPTGLIQDKWLQAFEIIPGNLSIVHDIVLSMDTTNTVSSDLSGNCNNLPSENLIGTWIPGGSPVIFPNTPSLKVGMRIPAGAHFVFHIHYAPGSGGMLDSTKIRLFFYPSNETGIRQIHSDVFIQYWGSGGFDIPANTTKLITVTPAVQTKPHIQPPANDISIVSVRPFSRNICAEVTEYALKGADTIPIIHIKEWNYEWNGNYYFPKLLKIPVGYTFKTERFFDNTIGNQHQPSSPPINVNFGTSVSNEMIYDSFQWLDYKAGDELLNINALVANDTLLKVGINEFFMVGEIRSFIYPNPASDKLTIVLSKKSEYTACIITIAGQTILQLGTFADNLTVDIKSIPVGLYMIKITDVISKETITKKIVITD
jgi:hypothetical protein